MGRRHWLDPVARRLLQAAGQIPPPATAQPTAPSLPETDHRQQVEQELLALKLEQDPGLPLRTAEEVRHAAALGWRLDVNRATAADWRRLPGITPQQVDLLQRLRSGGVQLSGPEDLQRLLGVGVERIRCWQPLLEFRWYGSPEPARPAPLDLNRADGAELEGRLPGWPPQRRARLLQERRRAPFRDLADLQARLQLSPALVEDLIGRVRFGEGPGGPSLPPRPRRSSS